MVHAVRAEDRQPKRRKKANSIIRRLYVTVAKSEEIVPDSLVDKGRKL